MLVIDVSTVGVFNFTNQTGRLNGTSYRAIVKRTDLYDPNRRQTLLQLFAHPWALSTLARFFLNGWG